MPYKDPQKKLAKMKEWREKKMKEGYGKAIYARRKQRYDNELTLRLAVIDAISLLEKGNQVNALLHLRQALEQAPAVGDPINYMPKQEDTK